MRIALAREKDKGIMTSSLFAQLILTQALMGWYNVIVIAYLDTDYRNEVLCLVKNETRVVVSGLGNPGKDSFVAIISKY